MIEGGANQWAILGGNAQSGTLATDYSGVRPSGYNPMKKQGAIILGIGGDNSKSSAGTFYEGVMTSGYPTAATEAAVQANIVAAGYGGSSSSGATGTIVAGDDSSDCVDNNNASGTDGNKVQMWACDGNTAAQNWTVNSNGTLTIDWRLPGHHRRQVRQRDADRMVALQRRRQPAMGGRGEQRAGQPDLRPMPRRSQRQHHQRNQAPDMELQRCLQPEMD